MSDAPLLPVSDAIRAILARAPSPSRVEVPLEAAAGAVLADDVRADADVPAFAKSMMDGYAVRAADLRDLPAELEVVEFVPAGVVPARRVGPGQASKVMTGAPVPEGADAVVMVERTEARAEGRVRILAAAASGKNVTARGGHVREGDVVLAAGRTIGPDVLAVLATVGRVLVPVHARPRVAVAATGDEVVPPGERPGPGRIRNSNSSALTARLRRDGAEVRDLGIVPDDLEATRAAVRGAPGVADVLVLTGGVSMGDRDLVGGALLAEGFTEVFHRVNLKPGKPVLFGSLGGVLVFGLPGNPVSVAATYELFVRPAIRTMLGAVPVHRPRVRATLLDEPPRAIPREQYLPARLEFAHGRLVVSRVPWLGSADLCGAAGANAWLVVPGGGPAPERGAAAEVLVTEDEVAGILPEARLA